MYPSFVIAGLHIRSHVVLLAAAVVIGTALGIYGLERLAGINRRVAGRTILLVTLAVFAGGRGHFLWNTWGIGHYLHHPLSIFAVWQGLHAGGALVALLVATPLLLWAQGLRSGPFADAFAPAVGIGIALARLGCFLNGCCFGTTCDHLWCVSFPAGSPPHGFHVAAGTVPQDALASAPIHPLQLYFACAALLAASVALWWIPRRRYDGQAALIAATLYLVLSAAAELFRADNYPVVYLWAGHAQFLWIATSLACASLLTLCAAELRQRESLNRLINARATTR